MVMQNSDSANPDGSVEEWLRRRLEPEREIVERTIERSLAATSDRSISYRVNWRRCAAAFALVLVVTAAGIYLFYNPEKTRGTEASQDITITNASGNVEVFYRSRGSVESSTIPGRAVSREGKLTIFNHGHVVAVVQRNANPRYIILGGGS
jgi:hypothetical protein